MNIVSHANMKEGAWDAFCDASREAWLRHRTEGRRGALALDARNEDHSFGVIQNGILIAIAPLVTQPLFDTDKREFAFSINTRMTDTHSLPTPAPALTDGLTPAEREEVMGMCMREVDRLARELNIARIRMFTDPLISIVPIRNPFLGFGYIDASTVTYSIDLHHDEIKLRSKISKGHRSDISFAEKKNYEVDFFDDDITDNVWKIFTDLYKSAAGQSIGTPDRMKQIFGQIRSGFAVLALIRGEDADEYLSGAIIAVYKHGAYYGMAATNPKYRDLRGIGQFIQWRIIQELKCRGIERYDMGWQSGSTSKEAAIAGFKRHFGGEQVPMWIGAKTF